MKGGSKKLSLEIHQEGHILLGSIDHYYKGFGIYFERSGKPGRILRYGLICSDLCVNQDSSSCSVSRL